MPDEPDTLQEVLDVEQELNQRLADERRRVDEWRDAARREVEQWKASESAALHTGAARAREAAERQARDQAAERLARGRATADRLRALGDADLRRRLRPRLGVLLPGRAP